MHWNVLAKIISMALTASFPNTTELLCLVPFSLKSGQRRFHFHCSHLIDSVFREKYIGERQCVCVRIYGSYKNKNRKHNLFYIINILYRWVKNTHTHIYMYKMHGDHPEPQAHG